MGVQPGLMSPIWTVVLESEHVLAWQDTLGQGSVDAWCAAHGLIPEETVRGGVTIELAPDGSTTVYAQVYELDHEGKPYLDEDGDPVNYTVVTDLVQSLPEGIGTVIR